MPRSSLSSRLSPLAKSCCIRIRPWIAASLVWSVCPAAIAADLLTEDFNSSGEGSRYTSSTYAIGEDFFARTDSNPDPRHNAPGYTSLIFTAPQSGGYWASEDINSAGNPLGDHGIVRLNNLNVSGKNNLKVRIFLAHTDDRFDNTDSIQIQYAFDGNSGGTNLSAGSYSTIGQFVGNGADLFADANLKLDRNLNGVTFNDLGDNPPAELSTTMTEYVFDIPVTGTQLSVQVRINENGGTEEIAFDHIRITGDLAATDPPALAAIEGSAVMFTEGDSAS